MVVALLRGCSLDEVARLLSDYREAQQHHTDARVLALGPIRPERVHSQGDAESAPPRGSQGVVMCGTTHI